MRRILFLVLLALVFRTSKAQVSYGDLSFGNYNVKINVSTENDSVFLVVTFLVAAFFLGADCDCKIIDRPKLLIRLMDDSVILLEGKLIGTQNLSDGGVVISGVYIASNHIVSEAKFSISTEEILSFRQGVKKLRLNTSPKFHEKEWKRDKIGKKLYECYIKSSSNSFEDYF